jgi:Tol biopolymer transport system component
VTVQGSGNTSDIGLSPDGRTLVTVARLPSDEDSYRRGFRVVSAESGAEVHRFAEPKGRSAWVIHTVFSPDGRWVAATLGEAGVVVMRADDWTEQYRVAPKMTHYIRLAFSPNCRFLVVCTGGGQVEVHDVANGRLVREWADDTNEGHSVAFAPDGDRVVFASSNGTARVYRLADGTTETVIAFDAYTAEFSPDGRSIALSGNDGLAVVDAADGRRRMTLIAPDTDTSETVNTCRYTADGARLLTTSPEGAVRLWDTATGQELLTLHPFEDFGEQAKLVTGVVSPDGRRIAVNSRNGLVRVIGIPSPDPVLGLDPAELVRVAFQERLSRDEVLVRLMTDPFLTPAVRSAAVRLAERSAENLKAIGEAMWNGEYPVDPILPAMAERHLWLAGAVLRAKPADIVARLNRGVALYHLRRFEEAEAELAALKVPLAGSAESTEEGLRLAFLALTRAAQAKYDAAIDPAMELERKFARHGGWQNNSVVRDALAAVRKVVPPKPIPWAE